MNNACLILPKQLCSASLWKHGIVNANAVAARQAFTSRSFASIAPLRYTEIRPRSRQSSICPDRSETGTIFHSFRLFHSSPICMKRPPGSNVSPKQKPQKLPPRAAERAKIPFGALSKHELSNIYQHDVDYVQGNEVLRMLHERRLSGSLIDKGIQPESDSSIPTESLAKAVEWLREKYPVDEKEAARRWTAQETARVEAKYIADAERLGIYKRSDESRSRSTSDTSKSVLEEIKRYNEQKRIREEQEAEKSGQAQASRETALARQEEKEKTQLERAERISKKREERARKGMVTTGGDVPEMTMIKRIVYPGMFGFCCLVLMAVASSFYTPVQQSDRMFPDVPVSVATVSAIAAVNVLVFLLWRVPPAWRILNTYFTQVPAYPYAFSVIGNTVSHRRFSHLAPNVLIGLYFFGIEVHEEVGRGKFLEIYMSGCILGSLFSLFYYIARRQFSYYSQGASGGVFALMTAWAVFSINKPPASTATPAFALDVSRWAVISTTVIVHFFPKVRMGIDWLCHIGGAVVGLVFSVTTVMERNAAQKEKIGEDQRIDTDEERLLSRNESDKP